MQEPTDYEFDRFHTIKDSNGNIQPHLTQSLLLHRNRSFATDDSGQSYGHQRASSRDSGYNDEESVGFPPPRRRRVSLLVNSVFVADSHSCGGVVGESVNSVLMAEGLHRQVSKKDMENLPSRYEKGSTKASLQWFGAICVAGLGMFLNAYITVTTGQLKTVWNNQFPTCWQPDHEQNCPESIQCCGLFPNTPISVTGACAVEPAATCTADGTYPDSVLCDKTTLGAVSYVQFAGIMLGMILFGKIGDCIGRVRAGIITSFLMLSGIALLTFAYSANTNTLFLLIAIAFGIFGLGVGGEYPLTAMGATEHHVRAADDALDDNDQSRQYRALLQVAKAVRRGETIGLAFAMQGVGSVVGSVFLLFLVYFSGQSRVECGNLHANSAGVDPMATNAIWRSFFLIGGTFCMLLFLYRTLVVEEGDGRAVLEARKKKREAKLGKGSTSQWKIMNFYGSRLVGASVCWGMVDFSYYGLKIFSGPIFETINPSGDLAVLNGYLVLYNLCSLAGFYVAAVVIDIPWIGRKRLAMASFAGQMIVYFIMAAVFNRGASPDVLVFLFFLGNFLTAAGADTAVYTMATESFPTEIRGFSQGICAFSGKLGAFFATLLFTYVDVETMFWTSGAVNLIGFLFTFVFLADLTAVSLAEQDARFELFLEGRPERYKGRLNAPEHLSNWEIWTGAHGQYEPGWARQLIKEEMGLIKDHSEDSVQSNEVIYSGDMTGDLTRTASAVDGSQFVEDSLTARE